MYIQLGTGRCVSPGDQVWGLRDVNSEHAGDWPRGSPAGRRPRSPPLWSISLPGPSAPLCDAGNQILAPCSLTSSFVVARMKGALTRAPRIVTATICTQLYVGDQSSGSVSTASGRGQNGPICTHTAPLHTCHSLPRRPRPRAPACAHVFRMLSA